LLLVVGIAALIVRAVFVYGAVKLTKNDYRPFEAGDSPEYLHLARNVAFDGRYVREDATSHLIGLVRPPGYPLFCAALLRICGDVTQPIVWTQVPIAAGICVLATLLAQQVFAPRWASLLAGSIAVFSPTGIGLTAQVLAEILFTIVFIAGFLYTYRAAAMQSLRAALLAGVLFAAAQLIKPSLLLWPIAGIVPWLFIAAAHHTKVRWSHVAACSAIQLACALAWGVRNFAVDGLFTYSAVNARNLRMLVVPMIEEWTEAGHKPQMKDYFENYRIVGDRFNRFVRDADTSAAAADAVRMQMQESKAVIRAHPGVALRVYLFNLNDQLLTGWDLCNGKVYSRNEKPLSPTTMPARALPLGLAAEAPRRARVPTTASATTRPAASAPATGPTTKKLSAAQKRKLAHQRAIKLKKRKEALERRNRPRKLPRAMAIFKPLAWVSQNGTCQWLWLLATCASVVTPWLVPRARRDHEWRRRVLICAASWAVLLYAIVFVGTAFRGGSRLLYPVEFAVILLIVSNVVNFADALAARARVRGQ
jgi:hypothetical protein